MEGKIRPINYSDSFWFEGSISDDFWSCCVGNFKAPYMVVDDNNCTFGECLLALLFIEVCIHLKCQKLDED